MIQIHDIADSYTLLLLWIMITWRTAAAETVVLCIAAATLIAIADGSQSTNKKKNSTTTWKTENNLRSKKLDGLWEMRDI
jgi:tellurite resistance protein